MIEGVHRNEVDALVEHDIAAEELAHLVAAEVYQVAAGLHLHVLQLVDGDADGQQRRLVQTDRPAGLLMEGDLQLGARLLHLHLEDGEVAQVGAGAGEEALEAELLPAGANLADVHLLEVPLKVGEADPEDALTGAPRVQLVAQCARLVPGATAVRPVARPHLTAPGVAQLQQANIARQVDHIEDGVGVLGNEPALEELLLGDARVGGAAAAGAHEEARRLEAEQHRPDEVGLQKGGRPLRWLAADVAQLRALHRQRSNRPTGKAGQRGEALAGLPGDQRLVAAEETGHGLLDDGHKELLALGAAVHQQALVVAGQLVVHQNRGEAAVLVEADVVDALRNELPRDEHLLEEGRLLDEQHQGGEEPAVAEDALGNVARHRFAHHHPRSVRYGRLLIVGHLYGAHAAGAQPEDARQTLVESLYLRLKVQQIEAGLKFGVVVDATGAGAALQRLSKLVLALQLVEHDLLHGSIGLVQSVGKL